MKITEILEFGLSFVAISSKGLVPLVSTKLPFLEDIKLETFLLRYVTPLSMMIGQGDQFFTGLYGPFPVSNTHDWVAYTYSFFLLDVDIGTPRDDTNLFTIGILFIPRIYKIPVNDVEKIFADFSNELNNVKTLIDQNVFQQFVQRMSSLVQLDIPQIIEPKPVVEETPKKKEQFVQDLNVVENAESLIAVPWILHSVYHGLERASSTILGGRVNILEKLADEYTAEILDRFHLLDKLELKTGENAVKKALNLGIEHLEKVGEKVKIRAVSENKFELWIDCQFADAIHPYLPIDKCLWVKYLAAIVSKTLPPGKELHIYPSAFSDTGSSTFIEIRKKPFITLN
ncbi:MAG: hypothetical protein ACFFD1_04810 [Candidatus Thorarchaeota archaeon]